MSEEVIVSELKNIITDYVDFDGEFDISMSLQGDIGLDSFGLISMVCEIERNFNIRIPDYELTRFVQLSDLVQYIKLNVMCA